MKRSQSFDPISSRRKSPHTTLCFLFVRPWSGYARFVESFEYDDFEPSEDHVYEIRRRREEAIVGGFKEFELYFGKHPFLPRENQCFPVLFKRNSLPLSDQGNFKIPINVGDCDFDMNCGSFVKKWKIPRRYFFLIEDEKLCEAFLNALGSTDRNLYEEFRAFLVKPYVYEYTDWEDESKIQKKITFPLDASDIL